MRKKINIAFCDFWKGFILEKFLLFRCLDEFYDLEISKDPDLIVYSCFGKSFKEFDGIRVFFTGENVRPEFWDCDYALSFDYCERDNHLRLPLYVFHTEAHQLIKGEEDFEGILREKTKFCNFIYSNARCKIRNKFFKKLSQYKKVDAVGKLFKNIEGTIEEITGIKGPSDAKVEFLRPYKFTIAFENSSYPGYTTEKIIHPMMARSIPIYWGN
ncbi:MAG: glycosyltransferase [Prochloron sp. SP5CPC1]|nr:glycosyltransferase [Candidatus Paraprochloron terpiosi SP5CPC1]